MGNFWLINVTNQNVIAYCCNDYGNDYVGPVYNMHNTKGTRGNCEENFCDATNNFEQMFLRQ